MSPALQQLATELEAAKKELLPAFEGLRDFSRLDIGPQTLDIVRTALVDYDRRRTKIADALTALKALAEDGYPDLPVRQVPHQFYAELMENVETIKAAFNKFATIEEAATAEITAGSPEPK